MSEEKNGADLKSRSESAKNERSSALAKAESKERGRKDSKVLAVSEFLTSRKAIPVRILLLIFWLAALGFGGMAQGQISTVSENDQAFFLPESAESTQASEAAAEFQEGSAIPALIIAVNESDSELTADELAVVEQVAETLGEAQIPDDIALSELILGPVPVIPSEDGTSALLPVSLDTALTNELDANEDKRINSTIETMRTHIQSIVDDADGDVSDLRVYVSGPAGLAADLGGAFAGIDLTLLLVAVVLVFIILVIVYRSVFLPVAVLVTAIAALCAAVFVVYHLARAEVLDLNGQTQGILAILVIGATTDYCLLLIARYREELAIVDEPMQAMANSLRGSWEPILASGGTVIAGLLTLLISDLSSTASLGPIAAIGIVFAMMAAFTLLPGILLLPGKHARIFFWPAKIPHYDSHEEANAHGIWSKVAQFVGRNDRKVWIITLIALVALSGFAPQFRASGTSQTEQFVGNPDSVVGFDLIGEEFDAGSVQPTTVVVSEESADEAIDAISALDGVDSVSAQSEGGGMPAGMPSDAMPEGAPEGQEGPPADVEGAPEGEAAEGEGQEGPPADVANAEDAEPVVVDGRVLLNVTTTMPAEDKASGDVVRNIRDTVQEIDSEALVGGPAAQNLDTQETANRDFLKIFPIVLIVIGILLMILLRAIVAPLLLLVANVISFGTAMGISAILFNWVLDFPGADASVPLYSFVFLVALGIDYTIFLMSRAREESINIGTRRGMVRSVAVTGGVITSAGIVLAATFAALSVVPLLFMLQLAIIVAMGILIDTFIVRSLLIPGLVHDIGRKVWWPWTIKKVPADEDVTDDDLHDDSDNFAAEGATPRKETEDAK